METNIFNRRVMMALIQSLRDRYQSMPPCVANSDDGCTCNERNRANYQINAVDAFVRICDRDDLWDVI